ncbi:trigger factor [bacterium]|nr:trigger factor [bacterium]MCB2180388.1 trigger factor [bacterium]
MNIDTEILETHEAKLTVTVETDQFEGAKKKAAKQLAKKYKIPGFRPGKAPYAIVVKHLGDASITEQAISNLIDEVYPKAIEEADVSPYGPGSLEEMPSMDPPTFEFKVPLAPEIELPDYKELRVEFTPKEVTEENIQEVIENLRDSQAAIDNVERPIEEGDMVYIVLSGTRKGESDPDKKVLLEERRYPVIVEKKDADQESEYPFPGFSRKLIGLSVGNKKTFQHTFKDDYEFEDLRGVTGMYKVSIEEVKGRSLPEVNDDFAKSVGNYETLDVLKEDITTTLTEQFEADQTSAYESEIMDSLVADAKIKYPPQMLEDEIDDFIHDLEHQLSHQGLNIDLYLKSRGLEMSGLRDEVKEQAENRMKRGLILMEVAKQEEIAIPNEEINARVQRTIQEVAAYYSEEEAKRLGSGANLESLRSRIATDEVITRTLKLLRDTAMGKTQEEPETAEESITEAASETEEEEPVEEKAAEAVAETAEATEPEASPSEDETANTES